MDISREILQFLHYNPLSSREDIAKGTSFEGSDATLKRMIAALVKSGDVAVEGKARATRYRLSNQAYLLMPLNLDTYFALCFKARVVTCMPADPDDPDCYVINIAYSKTLHKWLYIDPVNDAWVMDENERC